MKTTKFLILIVITIISCSESEEESLSEMEKWKLGWRMTSSLWSNDHQTAEKQFDSLLAMNGAINPKFLITGLRALNELGKKDKIMTIMDKRDSIELVEICKSDLFTQELTNVKMCETIKPAEVSNPGLQHELIKMYVDDQATRGNIMEDIIAEYNLNKDSVTRQDGVTVDAGNREKLKSVFRKYGFPTRRMVGKDAMHGIFLIIQHADGDKEWQRNQLPKIKKAVADGDLDGQSYAYLYDRIRINSGEKQLYGTQFSNVSPANKTVTLAETENMDSLDYRRMEIGMMPIDMYKDLMLKSIGN